MKPPVSSCRSRMRAMCSTRSASSSAHPVHHGRRGAHAEAVRLAHDVEPLLRRRLRVGEDLLADALGKDFGAAPRDRLQAGRLEARQHVAEAHPLLPGDELDLRRREAVAVDRRVVLFQEGDEVDVVLQRQVGMDAPLQQDSGAVERQRLLHFPADLLEGEEITLLVPGRAVEGAEAALVDADVGVVDVAVDVVGRDLGVVEAVAHLVGRRAELEQVAVEQEAVGVAGGDSVPRQGGVEDLADGAGRGGETGVHGARILAAAAPG